MIPREIKPGVLILVSEEDVWEELLTGRKVDFETSVAPFVVRPGSDALCIVDDLSVSFDSSESETLSLI